MKKLSFKKLKENYTTDSTEIHKCSMYFPNTCAIRMSEALVKTDSDFINIFKSSVPNKWPHSSVRGAQYLGAILAKSNAFGPRIYGWKGTSSATIPQSAKNKQGVICFMNIPGFSGQGHIDLWDNNSAIGSDYWDAETIWL